MEDTSGNGKGKNGQKKRWLVLRDLSILHPPWWSRGGGLEDQCLKGGTEAWQRRWVYNEATKNDVQRGRGGGESVGGGLKGGTRKGTRVGTRKGGPHPRPKKKRQLRKFGREGQKNEAKKRAEGDPMASANRMGSSVRKRKKKHAWGKAEEPNLGEQRTIKGFWWGGGNSIRGK